MARNAKQIFGLWISTVALVALAGCEAPQNTVITPPQKQPTTAQPPASTEQPQRQITEDLEPKKEVRLSSQGFTGEIILSADSITNTEDGFEIPVFLEQVSPKDMVDTVSLKGTLPEGVELKEVKTPSGYTAQLDMSKKEAPVVYYHPYSIAANSYKPVVSSDEPIFTLVYIGNLTGPITFEGSYFQTSGVLIRTDHQRLAP